MFNSKEAILSNKDNALEGASRLMSRREVAALIGVHTETIKRYQHQGRLKAIILNSRLIRYERAEVEKLLQSGRVE